MSLQDILKSIKQDAEREADKIKKSAQVEINELEKKLAETIGRSQQKILADFKLKMEKQVKQIKFKKEAELKALILRKKQETIEKIYNHALARLDKKNCKEYSQVIKKAVRELPNIKGAKIMLTDSRKGETEIIIKKSRLGSGRDKSKIGYEIATQTIPSKGGFILESPTIRINNTLEALVGQAKDETGVNVAKILFE